MGQPDRAVPPTGSAEPTDPARAGTPSADARNVRSSALSSPFPSLSPSPESEVPPSEVSVPAGADLEQQTTPQTESGPGGDGVTERLFGSKPKAPVAAIFIHAGAGFHSTLNEHVHLEACSEAARLAMKFLQAGGSAVDAVEVAIKSLEDKEITNAGYGSNLTIDGIVEGDATIVDHLGRSGACGAVSMIKNPISLARLILDHTSVPLSLRRIPPNILVGSGARRYAEEHGMRLTSNDHLVSDGARARYCRWRQELYRAEAIAAHRAVPTSAYGVLPVEGKGRRAAALSSPAASTKQEQPAVESISVRAPAAAASDKGTSTSRAHFEEAPAQQTSATDFAFWPPRKATPHPKRLRIDVEEESRRADNGGEGNSAKGVKGTGRGPTSSQAMPSAGDGTFSDKASDVITDTVGAIAVDFKGNIAAGSSSGGIGMKHCGRIGPAALVGVGTAVLPAHPRDKKGTAVAAVTSGTGEHMATSMASHTCAERLYHNMRIDAGGSPVAEYDEDLLMKTFVLDDFMDHPGVKNQVSGGAIGVMAVKKTTKGIYFYFAHNTDSFALASLSSAEQDPLVVMSRLGARENVARGGRKIKSV